MNPLSANPTKWPNTLKQFVGNLLSNCLSVFDYFVGLALKQLTRIMRTVHNGIFVWCTNRINPWAITFDFCLGDLIFLNEFLKE